MLVADANTGWTQHEAVRVVRAVRDLDVYIEQPCLTYEECLAVRRQIPHPFVLDENIDDLGMLLRAKADLAMDVVNLKISKLGGLTQARGERHLFAQRNPCWLWQTSQHGRQKLVQLVFEKRNCLQKLKRKEAI